VEKTIEILFTNKFFLIAGGIFAIIATLAITKKLFKFFFTILGLAIISFILYLLFNYHQIDNIKKQMNDKINESSKQIEKSLPRLEKKIKEKIPKNLKKYKKNY